MMQRQPSGPRKLSANFVLCGFLLFAAAPAYTLAEPAPAAVSAFDSYISTVEARLVHQHRSPNGFIASLAQSETRLRQGELIIEQITPSTNADLPGAMLYHWRGTAFAPGAKAADFERLMKNFDAYPQNYSPQILQSKILYQQGDHFQVLMRVRQKHVITVVMDTTYDVTFARLDALRGYSISRSTQISEIDSPGTRHERGNIIRIVVKWLRNFQSDVGREPRSNLPRTDDGGFKTRHGEMRKQRHHKQIRNACQAQPFECGFDARIPVAHSEFDDEGATQARLEFEQHVAADHDERHAFLRADFFVCFRRLCGTLWQDCEMDDTPANQPRHVEHPWIHEKLTQIFSHV